MRSQWGSVGILARSADGTSAAHNAGGTPALRYNKTDVQHEKGI